jgi:hypothetical protein
VWDDQNALYRQKEVHLLDHWGTPIEPLLNQLPKLAVYPYSTTIQSQSVNIITCICCSTQVITKKTTDQMEPAVNYFFVSERVCCKAANNLHTIIDFETWSDFLFIRCVTLTY